MGAAAIVAADADFFIDANQGTPSKKNLQLMHSGSQMCSVDSQRFTKRYYADSQPFIVHDFSDAHDPELYSAAYSR